MKYRSCQYSLLLCFTCILTGCGDVGKAPVFPTSGIVIYNGKPMVGGGAISFIPVSPQKGKAAGGTITEDGSFIMSTYEEGDGSVAGEFRVTIYQSTSQEPDTESMPADGEAAGAKSTEPIQIVEQNDIIPPIYSDASKSPVTVKIDPNGNNESLKIELKRM
ncbi:hypothetical protein [Gimesia sp.]|uniref:hypothetical protein n=1 Tax=Gimesia sp. TaxID=2024833 RepID=UPI0025BBB888|nr:hypothetical protein [Gimesia sp.]|tara:strand:- start:1394 stop:1879 length:486 start_codon:yes stop_codon:yes gene_type:complete